MKMNYLEKLLQGQRVEWKTLGEVAILYGGLTGKNKNDFSIKGNARYIPYKNIFDNIEIDFNKLDFVNISESEKQHKVKYGDILFTGSSETAEEAGISSAVTTRFNEVIYLNSFSFGLRFNDDTLLMPEFAKYLFRSDMIRREIIKTASGVTRFNISKERFKKIQIPIPPLSVQKEIVKILDALTALTSELTLRQKQYQYYRDKLLTFGDEVEWKTLGEVCELQRGKTITAKNKTDGNIPVISGGQKPAYFTGESNREGETITVAGSGAYAGFVMYWNEPIFVSDAFSINPNTFILQTKYLYYFLLQHQYLIFNMKKGAGVPHVYPKDVATLQIPIPPLSEQKRIVEILDKFDTLTNSISEGLPKEIELRNKQYEYYREMLLGFER